MAAGRQIKLNWEDYDLLKLIANQSAQSLYLSEAERTLRASQQFQAFNQVSAFVAHDIKTVTAQLKLLHRNAQVHGPNPEFFEDLVDTLAHSVERMEKLQGQLREVEKPVSAAVPLAQLLAGLEANFRNHSPQPQFRDETTIPTPVSDPDRLASALTHLISNAIDATDAKGTVTVRCSEEGRWLVIEVEDTGAGMSQSFIRNDLFEPFASTKGLTGMGLGAYQAREYVRNLGGDLEVRSRVGEGSCFTVRLPREGQDA